MKGGAARVSIPTPWESLQLVIEIVGFVTTAPLTRWSNARFTDGRARP